MKAQTTEKIIAFLFLISLLFITGYVSFLLSPEIIEMPANITSINQALILVTNYKNASVAASVIMLLFGVILGWYMHKIYSTKVIQQ